MNSPLLEEKQTEEYTERIIQQCRILNLPHDLILIILQYYVVNSKDLIRFGCVCQVWRNIILISPLWHQENMKRFHSRHSSRWLSLSADEDCPYTETKEIATWYIRSLDDFLQHVNEAERDSRRNELILERKMMFTVFVQISTSILIGIAGMTLGVNWARSTVPSVLGFVSLYITLFISIIYVISTQQSIFPQFTIRTHIRRHEQSKLVQYVTAILGIFISISLTQYKLTSKSSLLWVEILIPVYFAVLTITIEFSKSLHYEIEEPTWVESLNCFLFPILILIPPVMSLVMYCSYLDYQHRHHSASTKTPYSPAACLLPISLHISFLIWYFLSRGYKTLLGGKPSNFWDAFISTKQKVLRWLVRCLILLCSAFGFLSTILFILLCFPKHSRSFLFTHFNILFYLVLIFLCCFILEFIQHQKIKY